MININNLSFYYQIIRPVFKDVSFNMGNGIYGLLGENGVGKTTLLHVISGLRFPKAGTCEVLGHESCYRNPEMLSQLFFLPEEFQAPAATPIEYAKYSTEFYPHFNQEQFEEYLDEFQVDRDRRMSEFSAGQKKKAMISYGLALNTPIALLDEPTNGLDIPSKTQFRKILSSLDTENKCVIISTHQVRDLANLIDPIIILEKNAVLLNNPVEEITRKIYFGFADTPPADALYSEQTMQGYGYVALNPDELESTLNIEMLFNAVVNNKATFRKLFNA